MTQEVVYMPGPIISVKMMDLARYVDVTGVGPAEIAKFSHEILWVRAVQFQIRLVHGKAAVVQENGVTYHDTRRFLGCIEDVLEAAQQQCLDLEITDQSNLRVEIVATVQSVPLLRYTGRDRKPFVEARVFGEVRNDWLVFDQAKKDEMDAYNTALGNGKSMDELLTAGIPYPEGMNRLQARTESVNMIWSSKLPSAVNALVVEEFTKRLMAELPGLNYDPSQSASHAE